MVALRYNYLCTIRSFRRFTWDFIIERMNFHLHFILESGRRWYLLCKYPLLRCLNNAKRKAVWQGRREGKCGNEFIFMTLKKISWFIYHFCFQLLPEKTEFRRSLLHSSLHIYLSSLMIVLFVLFRKDAFDLIKSTDEQSRIYYR